MLLYLYVCSRSKQCYFINTSIDNVEQYTKAICALNWIRSATRKNVERIEWLRIEWWRTSVRALTYIYIYMPAQQYVFLYFIWLCTLFILYVIVSNDTLHRLPQCGSHSRAHSSGPAYEHGETHRNRSVVYVLIFLLTTLFPQAAHLLFCYQSHILLGNTIQIYNSSEKY